jgi:hypothetical protein
MKKDSNDELEFQNGKHKLTFVDVINNPTVENMWFKDNKHVDKKERIERPVKTITEEDDIFNIKKPKKIYTKKHLEKIYTKKNIRWDDFLFSDSDSDSE